VPEAVNLALVGKAERVDLEAAAKFDPARTALIIVDMQYYSACRTMGLGKRFSEEGDAEHVAWRFDRLERLVVPNQRKLLDFFRTHGLTVIYVTLGSQTADLSDAARHMKKLFDTYNGRPGTLESRVLAEIAPQPGEFVFNKTTVGAFASTSLDMHLRHLGMRHLFFAGISTSACLGHTACFAADLEYDCTVIEDACADLLKDDHEWFLAHFRKFFGRVASSEAVIAHLICALETPIGTAKS
jgi:nicotinamidase-related amidase